MFWMWHFFDFQKILGFLYISLSLRSTSHISQYQIICFCSESCGKVMWVIFQNIFSRFLPLSGVGRWACCSCERGRGLLVWAGASDYPRTYHLVTMHMHNPQCTMRSACDPLTYHLVTMHCIICALHDSLCNIVICTMQYPCCFSYVNCLSCPEIH